MDQEPTEEPCDLHPGTAELCVTTALIRMILTLTLTRFLFVKEVSYAHQGCSKIQ